MNVMKLKIHYLEWTDNVLCIDTNTKTATSGDLWYPNILANSAPEFSACQDT